MNVHLALAADRNMEIGLHVTLYTALKFLHSDCSATLHLFLKDFSKSAIERLHVTLSPYTGRYDLQIYDADRLDLGEGRGLYSSKMPYVSLIAAQMIDAERVLFLDADLLILINVAEIFSHALDGKTAGIVPLHSITQTWSEEYDILKEVGLSDDMPYFSSGVVLFDAEQWKRKKLTEKCFELIEQFGDRLRNTDQTVLNAALGGDVFLLPDNYHRIFYSNGWEVPHNTSNCICHLGGAPKPWDFLGEFLNNSYPAFREYLKETAFSDYRSYLSFSSIKIKRTLLLSRCYYIAIRHRLKSRSALLAAEKVQA